MEHNPSSVVSSSTPNIGKISSLSERHRAKYDALRSNVATAPAGHGSSGLHHKISIYGEDGGGFMTPRASLTSMGGTPRTSLTSTGGQAKSKSVPPGGYMPSPRKTRSTVGGSSFLKLGSPRLAKWTLQDIEPGAYPKEQFMQDRSTSANSKMDVENQLSRAYIQVEKLLAGQTALDDFASAVKNAEGLQHWALWTEISSRLQVAQSASMSVLRQERKHVDEPGWALRNDRILAQSIMRKPLFQSKMVQTNEEDIDKESNPFHQELYGTKSMQHDGLEISRRPIKPVRNRVSHEVFGEQRVSPSRNSYPGSPLGSNVRVPGLEHDRTDLQQESHVMQLKVDALHLLHEAVGLDDKQLFYMLSHKLPGSLQSDLCRIFIVDEPSNELISYNDEEIEERIKVNESSEKSIAGETMRRKQYLHVPDVSTSSCFNASIDLGSRASRQAKWAHANLISFPVVSNMGNLEMIVIIARVSSSFSSLEIEACSWIAVILGSVLNNNKNIANRERQMQLVDRLAESAAILAREGCEVQDPRFWMHAFDAQVAQISLVHQDPADRRPLLYCNCSDTSKEEVSMTCYPLRGMHKKMILHPNGQPWWSSHAEAERGYFDREVDLGSSEWIGRTSMMLIPIMSLDGSDTGTREGQESTVLAIVMVASTERTYNAVHRKMLMAMTNHIRPALIKLLGSWDQDEAGTFKDSFIMSEALKKRTKEDLESPAFSHQDADLLRQCEELERENAEAALLRERKRAMLNSQKYYEYAKDGIARMLDEESAAVMRIRSHAREVASPNKI